jgi:uncharacterized damage-inducible protein DinB
MPQKKKKKGKAKSAPRRKAAKSAARKAGKRTALPRAAAGPSAKAQFLDYFQREHAVTSKVLRAMPSDQTEFRPHIRARAARELAFTFVMEQKLLHKALTGEPFFGGPRAEPPTDYRAVVDQFENDYAALVELIRKTPEARFHETVKFPTGPQQMGEWPVSQFMWFMLSDQIHHRGQFTIYLRMTGGKVPSIYGPSADEPWS